MLRDASGQLCNFIQEPPGMRYALRMVKATTKNFTGIYQNRGKAEK